MLKKEVLRLTWNDQEVSMLAKPKTKRVANGRATAKTSIARGGQPGSP
jgi:hypothetical protein